MNFVIVSTYPATGSQNVGDKLIEQSTISAIREVVPGARFETLWRAEDFNKVSDSISKADAIVFACFAIRENVREIYPYLEEVLESGKRIFVVSAGTDLDVNAKASAHSSFPAESAKLVRRLYQRSEVFTTRGLLSQKFCQDIGVNSTFSGDVAFFDRRFDDRMFSDNAVERIVVSDPHRGRHYRDSFVCLIEGLNKIYPNASISCAMHGVNSEIESLARELGLPVLKPYLSPDDGLDCYDDFHMHVGFRVHGHVSALKRRIRSYLLEQDGRGYDYGLTLERKISTPCFLVADSNEQRTAKSIARHILNRKRRLHVPGAFVNGMLSLIASHATKEVNVFHGLEAQIEFFNNNVLSALERLRD